MFKISHTFNKDDYVQNPILKRFCSDRKLEIFDTRPDLLNSFYTYAAQNDERYQDALNWILGVLKEGSKEFCYKKIYDINPVLKNPDILKAHMVKIFPNCPFINLLEYNNTTECELIEYKIFSDDKGEVTFLSMVFSQLVLEGYERNVTGEETIFPIFIDVYFEEGFIVSRAKAKSTVYYPSESKLLTNDNHMDTKIHAVKQMDFIIKNLGFTSETDNKKVKNSVSQMLFKLYNEFSFTPDDIVKKIQLVNQLSEGYVKKIFTDLSLLPINIVNAMQDISIFVEKYISINGNNEDIFKKDRDAYLVKVTSDDVQDMTKVDTTSSLIKPLQCTDAFFDSKKAIIKNKKCDRIHLCFRRKKSKYFGNTPFCVQFSTKSNYGTFKIAQYAEEDDINHVLQTIFKNY